jgi:hypothetical protein
MEPRAGIQQSAAWQRGRPVLWLLLAVLGLLLSALPNLAQSERPAIVLEIDGAIGPAVSDYLTRGITHARERDAGLLVVRLDTPGGLDTSMREMIRTILASPVPVVTFVHPSGARPASAGTIHPVWRRHYDDDAWLDLRDATLIHSGRPVLILPRSGLDEAVLDRVVIAWKESVQAARAVAAAQSFLVNAKEVYLISVGESAEDTISLCRRRAISSAALCRGQNRGDPARARQRCWPSPAGQGRRHRRPAGNGCLQPLALARADLSAVSPRAVLHAARTPVLMMY